MKCIIDDCPLPAHCAIELPEVPWAGGVLPEVWQAVCDDHLADHHHVRVIDFAGA